MAEQGTIARPYAQAVFETASADGQLAAWSDLLKLAGTIVLAPEVQTFLTAPGAELDRLAVVVADLCRERLGASGTVPAPLQGGAASPATNLLRLLAANGRLGALPEIAARYDVLKAQAENVLDVVLSSAAPVSDEQQASIAKALQQRFGRQIRL